MKGAGKPYWFDPELAELEALSKGMPEKLETLEAAWVQYAADVGVIPGNWAVCHRPITPRTRLKDIHNLAVQSYLPGSYFLIADRRLVVERLRR